MISTRQLSYALAVERTLHFKKAAQLCHISQSALSTALAELERTLGVQIFERDNRKVLVTPLGQEVLSRANRIMVQIEELELLAQSFAEPLSFPISIGMIPTIAPYLVPRFLPLLRAQYPLCQPILVEEQSHVLVDKVKRGELDTAILALPYDCQGLLTFEFWAEDFYWVALKGEKLTDQTEVSSADLADRNLMLLKDGHCLKEHILDLCKLPEPKANRGFGTASLTTLVQMVLQNMGTTLIPQMAIEMLTSPYSQLTTVHLNESSPHRKIAFLMRPNYTRMSSIEALIELCKTGLETSVGGGPGARQSKLSGEAARKPHPRSRTTKRDRDG